MNYSKSELEMICEFSQASLLEIIKFQENEYIKTHKNDPDWNQKYYKLKQLKMDLYSKNVISEEDLIILRNSNNPVEDETFEVKLIDDIYDAIEYMMVNGKHLRNILSKLE